MIMKALFKATHNTDTSKDFTFYAMDKRGTVGHAQLAIILGCYSFDVEAMAYRIKLVTTK